MIDRKMDGHKITWRQKLLSWQRDPDKLFNRVLEEVLISDIDLDSVFVLFRNTDRGEFGFKGVRSVEKEK